MPLQDLIDFLTLIMYHHLVMSIDRKLYNPILKLLCVAIILCGICYEPVTTAAGSSGEAFFTSDTAAFYSGGGDMPEIIEKEEGEFEIAERETISGGSYYRLQLRRLPALSNVSVIRSSGCDIFLHSNILCVYTLHIINTIFRNMILFIWSQIGL